MLPPRLLQNAVPSLEVAIHPFPPEWFIPHALASAMETGDHLLETDITSSFEGDDAKAPRSTTDTDANASKQERAPVVDDPAPVKAARAGIGVQQRSSACLVVYCDQTNQRLARFHPDRNQEGWRLVDTSSTPPSPLQCMYIYSYMQVTVSSLAKSGSIPAKLHAPKSWPFE